MTARILPFVVAPSLQEQLEASVDALNKRAALERQGVVDLDLDAIPQPRPRPQSALMRNFDSHGHGRIARATLVGGILASLIFGAAALIKNNSSVPAVKSGTTQEQPRAFKVKTATNYIPQ